MHLKRHFYTALILLTLHPVYSQENTNTPDINKPGQHMLYGFVRGGLYGTVNNESDDKPFVSSLYSDFGLMLEMDNAINFKAYADLRFRYGAEFSYPVNEFDLREAWVKFYGKRWTLSAGKEIVKWGRADFTNINSRLSPQNFISRSTDRADMDMGNLLTALSWYPADFINLDAVLIPFYRSSVLIIDPIPLPDNVSINQITSLVTGKDMFSYGLKADIHIARLDMGLNWFDGYDPMPGTELTGFNLDMSGPIPVPLLVLSNTPYKTRVLGIDFETYAGNIGIRGEAALSVPYLSYETREFVPWPEIRWVSGFDWSPGTWRIIFEYSGKNIPDFMPSDVDQLIGTEPDYSALAVLMTIPGFDLESYVRQQVGSFNRLYNYQLERNYHSAAMRIETEMAFGKLLPSFFAMYNITSRDLLLIPEMKYKPTDGLTITAGAELYSGRSGSLYDLVDGFMNSIYVALRVDF